MKQSYWNQIKKNALYLSILILIPALFLLLISTFVAQEFFSKMALNMTAMIICGISLGLMMFIDVVDKEMEE